MTRKKALGDDPLFTSPDRERSDLTGNNFPSIVSAERIDEVKKTISEMRDEVKRLEKRKKNLEDNYQRMTFIVRKDLLDKLRDYCYTERISQKDGLEKALSEFLDDKEDLVTHPEKEKQTRKRI